MKDLTHPAWIKAKGILFLFVGIAAATLLLVEHPSWKAALLLALAVWAFCRFYYFAFYVIGHYVDPTYKFAGLWSFLSWLLRHRRSKQADQCERRSSHARALPEDLPR